MQANRRHFLKSTLAFGGVAATRGLGFNSLAADSAQKKEQTIFRFDDEAWSTHRTFEPGRLIPFLCLDKSNLPENVVVCAVSSLKDAEPVVSKGNLDSAQFCTVLFDPRLKRYRMWYGGWDPSKLDYSRWGQEAPNRGYEHRRLYAESEDGIHWNKPNLGLVEFKGSRNNNVLSDIVHTRAILMDERESDPRKRFKGLQTWGGNQRLSYSEDGIRWYEAGQKAIHGPRWAGYHESHCFFTNPDCPDPERRFMHYCQALSTADEYRRPLLSLALPKPSGGSKPYSTLGGIRRRIAVAYGPSETAMRVWPDPAMDPDDGLEEQVHTISVTPYEGYYLALYDYTWFDLERRTHACDLRLAASRDGFRFTRIQNQVPVVPRGLVGNWDDGSIVSPNQLVRAGDELYIYYTGKRKEGGLAGIAPSSETYMRIVDCMAPPNTALFSTSFRHYDC